MKIAYNNCIVPPAPLLCMRTVGGHFFIMRSSYEQKSDDL